MIKVYLFLLFFFFTHNTLQASNKDNVINKLNKIENLSFNFIQTIDGKDEKGKCTIQYPKKIFCEYEVRTNKIIVSNGKSIVIKKGKQYFRYPIKSTPFELLLDKSFLIDQIKKYPLKETNEKYLFFQVNENNNNINIFFSKENYGLVGWQVEDVYQNLSVTYIFNTIVNKKIDDKLFKLPKNN